MLSLSQTQVEDTYEVRTQKIRGSQVFHICKELWDFDVRKHDRRNCFTAARSTGLTSLPLKIDRNIRILPTRWTSRLQDNLYVSALHTILYIVKEMESESIFHIIYTIMSMPLYVAIGLYTSIIPTQSPDIVNDTTQLYAMSCCHHVHSYRRYVN